MFLIFFLKLSNQEQRKQRKLLFKEFEKKPLFFNQRKRFFLSKKLFFKQKKGEQKRLKTKNSKKNLVF